MLAAPKLPRSRSATLIGGLVVVALAAISLAVPPAPIELQDGSDGIGSLEASSQFSDGLSEQNAANGFGYLALDLTGVTSERRSFWRQQLDLLAARRYPVWGWVDTGRLLSGEAQLIDSLQLAGVYLYGAGAPARAAALRNARSDLTVIVVQSRGKGDPQVDAIALDLESYLASSAGDFARPVLIADQLGEGDVRSALAHARALAGEDGNPALLIARIPLLP